MYLKIRNLLTGLRHHINVMGSRQWGSSPGTNHRDAEIFWRPRVSKKPPKVSKYLRNCQRKEIHQKFSSELVVLWTLSNQDFVKIWKQCHMIVSSNYQHVLEVTELPGVYENFIWSSTIICTFSLIRVCYHNGFQKSGWLNHTTLMSRVKNIGLSLNNAMLDPTWTLHS